MITSLKRGKRRGDTLTWKGMQCVTGKRGPIFLPSKNSALGGAGAQSQTGNILLSQGLRCFKSESLTYKFKGSMASFGRTFSQSNLKSVVVAATNKVEASNGEMNEITWP